jgi:hypothetical protein
VSSTHPSSFPECAEARERVLLADSAETGGEAAEHVAGCDGCRDWVARARRVESLLRGLPRLPAPAILADRVLDPSPFDPFVPLAPGDGEGGVGDSVARSLARLARPRTPSVLDRLVAEELADPAASRARRFVGDLERREVPAALERRVARPVSPEGDPREVRAMASRPALRLAGPLAGLAAAALVVWISYPSAPAPATGSGGRSYSFTVRRVGSADELDPLALSFVHGLGGVLPGDEGGR